MELCQEPAHLHTLRQGQAPKPGVHSGYGVSDGGGGNVMVSVVEVVVVGVLVVMWSWCSMGMWPRAVLITYTNRPTRWRPSGLTPTHHHFARVGGVGWEHTKMVPALVVLGRRDEV